MCGNGVEGVFGVGVGAKRVCGKGAVDSQHGTSVEGFASLHKGLLPKVKAFLFLL
jgi:hypothetical protein